ncbi:MAG: pentapeptide repeat-containing protein [Christensenellaceae bacterium]|jgi:uncharacterized protein YjbI with pentapeptide repeats/DNA-binding XRE family transcriptional regulator|nr:pentapeptide repeat-containing protein [Christensenellaceae bacterium]
MKFNHRLIEFCCECGDNVVSLVKIKGEKMINEITVGKKIAELRKSNGLSQGDIAAMLNVTPQAVSKWERGGALPDIILLEKLSSGFGLSLGYFGGENRKVGKDNNGGKEYGGKEYFVGEDESIKFVKEGNGGGNDGTNPQSIVNLSLSNWKNVDFSGLDNLGEKFSFSNIEKSKFVGANLRGIVFKANNVVECDFSGANLDGIKISSGNIKRNDFSNANFSNAKLYTTNIDATNIFTGAKFLNTEIKHTNLAKVVFADLEIKNCFFVWANFSKAVFQNVTLIKTIFKDCKMKKTAFVNCKADATTVSFLKNSGADVSCITLL